MARAVDPKRTRKALRRVRALTQDKPAEEFSGWETEFLTEVGARLETYGSAFRDSTKGRPDEALSTLQHQKLAEIAAKAKGKARKPMGWKNRPPPKPPRERDEE